MLNHLESTVQHWSSTSGTQCCCKGWPWLPLLQTCAVQSVVQTSAELGGTVYVVASGVVMVYILCTTAAFSKQQQQPSAPKFSCENSVWYIFTTIIVRRKFVKWKHWLATHVSWRVFHARSAMNAVNQKSLASSGMSAMLCCSGEKDSAGRDLKSAQNTPSRQPMQPPYTMGTGQFMAPTQQQQQLVGVNLTIFVF